MSIKDCPRVPITDVLSFIVDNRGKTVPIAETGMPLIATNCILNERLYPVFENIRYVSDDILQNWFRAHLKPHDILFVNKGTPGRCCLVPDPVTFCAAQDMIGLRCDTQKIYYRYLLMVLRSAEIQKTISNNHVGLVIPHFKKENLPQLMIPVPEMEEQKALGDLYFQLCEKIENNNAICSNLEAVAKLLYDYWFVQFDFPDENGKPYKSSGGKMVWNEDLKREIPAGWESKSISDISKRVKVGFVGTVDKYYCSNDEGYPIVRPAEMSADGIDYSSLKHITFDFYNKNKKSQVHKNDILISRCGKDGIPNIYDSDEPAQVLNAVIIEPDEDAACSCFINEMLKSDYSQVQISHGTSGSVQGVINTEMIAKIIMPYNFGVVNHFTERIEEYYAMIRNAKKENQQLASLRDFLLPMLMNGQVKVGKAGA